MQEWEKLIVLLRAYLTNCDLYNTRNELQKCMLYSMGYPDVNQDFRLVMATDSKRTNALAEKVGLQGTPPVHRDMLVAAAL